MASSRKLVWWWRAAITVMEGLGNHWVLWALAAENSNHAALGMATIEAAVLGVAGWNKYVKFPMRWMRWSIRDANYSTLVALASASAISAQRGSLQEASLNTGPSLKHTRVIDFTAAEGTLVSVDVSPDARHIVFDLLTTLRGARSLGLEMRV